MEALSVPLQERLLAGRLDAAVIHNPLPTPLVRIEPVLTESLCLLSPARGARGRSVDFQTLSKFELIFPGAPHPIRSLVEAEALRRSVELRVVLEIDAIGTSLQLVAEGYGHAVGPYNVVCARECRALELSPAQSCDLRSTVP
jgi:LysR family transcriptional regulator, nitrogen assimilation regulatory protein